MTYINNRNKVFNQGFTLLELMIVVAIVGLLAAIAIPSYSEYVMRGYRKDAKDSLLQLASALENYKIQNNSYLGATIGQTAGAIYPDRIPLNGKRPIYQLTMTLTKTNFTLTATPMPGTRLDGDGVYTLTDTRRKTYSGTKQDDWK